MNMIEAVVAQWGSVVITLGCVLFSIPRSAIQNTMSRKLGGKSGMKCLTSVNLHMQEKTWS